MKLSVLSKHNHIKLKQLSKLRYYYTNLDQLRIS